MPKLEGIIYKAFGNYVVLRGFAPIGEIAKASRKPESYQRDADEKHKRDIIEFMANGKYTYFPDVILACRAENYSDFITKVGSDDDVDFSDVPYVDGLNVMREYLPVNGHRARHANINIGATHKFMRIDGNHRLEPFDEKLDWWTDFLIIPDEVKNEDDPTKKKGWIDYNANEYRNNIAIKIIPFTIIFTEITNADNFEAGIFHNINFKHLPLKLEASLKIITELSTFDIDSLGEEYILASSLIVKTKQGFYKGIDLLMPQTKEKENYFRTSCLRISQLLNKQKASNPKLLKIFESPDLLDQVEEVIQLLRPLYKAWGKTKQGSTALLAAIVYFGLVDENKQKFFIEWVDKNGINKLSNEHISKSTSQSIVEMFEKVYQAKKSEVFISMQFGDPQSELIYEKIFRAIEAYNKESSRDIKITPLRIDEYFKGKSYTITDEILEAINSCSLLIADLSSGNKNVYHEIGYAMALAKVKDFTPSVLLLLKEDTDKLVNGEDLEKFVGFNIRGFSQLRFKKYDDLIDKLQIQLKKHFES